VVFSTHNMDQAEQLCDSVCIIAQGRKVLDGPLRDIRRSHAGQRYRVEFEAITPGVVALMDGSNPALRGAVRMGDAWELDLPAPADVQRALAVLAAADAGVSGFHHVKPSLHQIFVNIVGHAETAERRPEVARA
jgi:ABC-2 type transport system ATP-binding protein